MKPLWGERQHPLYYMLVVAFLRGFIKGLVLTTAFFVVRDVREHRRQDRGKLF